MISIGQMAKLCRTSVQTLRWYDQKEVLTAAYVDPVSHYRYYDAEQIFQFHLIKYLQGTDMRLDEIKSVLTSAPNNLTAFWQEQEKNVRRQLEEDRQRLQLVRFQQEQARGLAVMKEHLDGVPYRRKLQKQVVAVPAPAHLTTAAIPDSAVTILENKLLQVGQLPNLEYGFTFSLADYQQLTAIDYQQIFKEPIFPLPAGSTLTANDVSGTYLCVEFMWSRKHYLKYLRRLIHAYQPYRTTATPLVYEESYPLNYLLSQFKDGRNSITELRIKLD